MQIYRLNYMVQTCFNTLHVYENLVGYQVIDEREEKIKRLKVLKKYSIRPVLVHVNGVENSISRLLDSVSLERLKRQRRQIAPQ